MPLDRLKKPFQEFAQLEASGGILLFAGAVLALAWANSPWAEAYEALWRTPLGAGFGPFRLEKPLLLWINDGLMAVFFFLVGLEIKREVLTGELAAPRQAALPLAAAIGGILVPAGIYLAFNAGTERAIGWGIPMATDIAFALGVLALLGDRAPLVLKVFLTALAIVDDLAAVLVIAIFYTAGISGTALSVAAAIWAILVVANRLGVRSGLFYLMAGVGLWVATVKSGVHATVAGVLLAMVIPARAAGADEPESLLERLEHHIHPWVTYAILPVFALANAGVSVAGGSATWGSPLGLGIATGLLVGKPLGVVAASWLAVRTKLAVLPDSMTWMHVVGIGFLAGIGFTMSLFIAALAFGGGPLLAVAKLSILAASLVAGTIGWALLRTRA